MLHKDLIETFITNGFTFKRTINCNDEALVDEIEYWTKDDLIYIVETLDNNVVHIFQQIDYDQLAT